MQIAWLFLSLWAACRNLSHANFGRAPRDNGGARDRSKIRKIRRTLFLCMFALLLLWANTAAHLAKGACVWRQNPLNHQSANSHFLGKLVPAAAVGGTRRLSTKLWCMHFSEWAQMRPLCWDALPGRATRKWQSDIIQSGLSSECD